MNWFLRILRDADPAGTGGGGAAVIDAPGAPGSATIKTPLPAAGTPQAAPTAPTFTIPDAYKDKPYLKGVDSTEKLYTMLDGAQTLLGKRPAGIPAPDAPAEEWSKFYDALGRPKAATEYQFDGADKADPKFVPELQKVFHKHGLTAAQAKGIYSDVNGVLASIAEAQGINLQKQNTDFDALGTKVFGAQRDQILASSKALLDKFTPPEMKAELAKLSNENLIILSGVLNNINKTYIKADGAPGGQPQATGMTPADISAKARELMLTKEYTDPFNPRHEQVKKQVSDLYDQLRKK